MAKEQSLRHAHMQSVASQIGHGSCAASGHVRMNEALSLEKNEILENS